MQPQEQEIYIKRMAQQYNEMLSYRELIQAEIEIAKNKLKTLEGELIRAQEVTSKVIKDNKQLEESFKTKNADRIKDLETRESLIEQKKEENNRTKESLLTREIEVQVRENLTKARGLDQDARDELIATRERKCTDWETYLKHRSDYLEGLILEAETKRNKLEVSQTALDLEHKELQEDRGKLTAASLVVQKREEAVQAGQDTLDKERAHFESQRISFKLAVEEAKRRWPMLK